MRIRKKGYSMPKVLTTDADDVVRISPLINSATNLITQVLELRNVSCEYFGLIIEEKDLIKHFDVVEDISMIEYFNESGKFYCYHQIYKSKTLNYYVVVDKNLNTSYDEEEDFCSDGVYKLYSIGFDPEESEEAEEITKDLNNLFKKFDNNASQVAIVLKTMSGFNFKNHKIKPLDVDIDLMYNDDFQEVHEHIVESLNEGQKGIILLHGKAGTGKTNYIKYLTTLVPKKKFVFIPVNMVPYLTDPSFLNELINNKGSVLVLEDSETFLRDRDSGENSVVSTILNLSDGMLSDVLGIQIICTFNSDLNRVDEALLRKGRLIDEYEFNELEIDKAQTLSDTLGIDIIVDKPMTLAEITNYKDKAHRDQRKVAKKIGFGR